MQIMHESGYIQANENCLPRKTRVNTPFVFFVHGRDDESAIDLDPDAFVEMMQKAGAADLLKPEVIENLKKKGRTVRLESGYPYRIAGEDIAVAVHLDFGAE